MYYQRMCTNFDCLKTVDECNRQSAICAGSCVKYRWVLNRFREQLGHIRVFRACLTDFEPLLSTPAHTTARGQGRVVYVSEAYAIQHYVYSTYYNMHVYIALENDWRIYTCTYNTHTTSCNTTS